MRRALAALLLTLAVGGVAQAQVWGFGTQYRFGGDLVANLTLEFPAFDLLGLRAGPSVAARGHVGPTGYGGAVMAGLTVAFVPSAPELPAVMLEVNYEVLLRSGESARYGPGIALFMSGRW